MLLAHFNACCDAWLQQNRHVHAKVCFPVKAGKLPQSKRNKWSQGVFSRQPVCFKSMLTGGYPGPGFVQLTQRRYLWFTFTSFDTARQWRVRAKVVAIAVENWTPNPNVWIDPLHQRVSHECSFRQKRVHDQPVNTVCDTRANNKIHVDTIHCKITKAKPLSASKGDVLLVLHRPRKQTDLVSGGRNYTATKTGGKWKLRQKWVQSDARQHICRSWLVITFQKTPNIVPRRHLSEDTASAGAQRHVNTFHQLSQWQGKQSWFSIVLSPFSRSLRKVRANS